MYQNKLPAQRTIRKWYESINGAPGCTSEALFAIKIKTEEAKKANKRIIVNVVMDEIFIRKHIEYNKNEKKMYGYVDFGGKISNDNAEQKEAKEALTFLLNAVNDHWKIPIAYFLVNSLNSKEKAGILREVLIFLSQADVTVASVTFDGCSTNLAMAKELGANLNPDNMKAYFIHPITQKTVYIFLDICHMLKLVRNTMSSKLLKDADDKFIMWAYIDKLEKLQAREGVLLANKLKAKHTEFANQKMKTSLAAQTLSLSVAAALEYLRESNNEDFNDCQPTVKFIKIFNNIFDICNSRSKFGLGFKQPINKETSAMFFEYIDEAIEYIKNLKIWLPEGEKKILKSNSKTRFLGFIIALTNFKLIYETYCINSENTNDKLEYILTFKFSQDHLELLFSIIRSRGGWNNNPTATQFASAYKRLIIHNELKASSNANCTDFCNTSILTVSSTNAPTWKNHELSLIDESNLADIVLQHNTATNSSSVVTDVVVYISGYVENKILKRLKCNECIACLNKSAAHENCTLIDRKEFLKGLLIRPKKDIVKICKIAENFIFCLNDINEITKPNAHQRIISNCFKEILFQGDIFENMNNHVMECEPLVNHKYLLIKLILEEYIKIKLFHISNIKTAKFQQKKIRQSNNKETLRCGQ